MVYCPLLLANHHMPLKRDCYCFSERKKSPWPHTHVKYIQRFVGLSEYNFIRKMLNNNHLGKVPSKAAER